MFSKIKCFLSPTVAIRNDNNIFLSNTFEERVTRANIRVFFLFLLALRQMFKLHNLYYYEYFYFSFKYLLWKRCLVKLSIKQIFEIDSIRNQEIRINNIENIKCCNFRCIPRRLVSCRRP